MSYQDFINNLKAYNDSITQGPQVPYPIEYQGEDLESFLQGKENPPKEAVAALEHVYSIKRAVVLKKRTPVDYFNLAASAMDSTNRLYDEVIIPEFEKKVRI